MSRPVCPVHKVPLADKHGKHGPFFGCPKYKTDRCTYTEDYTPRINMKRVIIDLTADEETTVEEPQQPRRSKRLRRGRKDLADYLL